MTWETIPLRGSGVSVAWRRPGGQGAGLQLALTLSSGVCAAMGAAPGCRIVVQRDRMAGKLRIAVAQPHEDGARKLTWKATKFLHCATLFIPLRDVQEHVREQKPAQTCRYEVAPGEVIIKLPAWACPPVLVANWKAA
jgi:hypothetical protein